MEIGITLFPRVRNSIIHASNDHGYYNLVSSMRNYDIANDGNNKFVQWFYDNGFSIKELNKFREKMIEGHPEILKEENYKRTST